jgi:hypothetical protein
LFEKENLREFLLKAESSEDFQFVSDYDLKLF